MSAQHQPTVCSTQ